MERVASRRKEEANEYADSLMRRFEGNHGKDAVRLRRGSGG
jgi:hypothetical protein